MFRPGRSLLAAVCLFAGTSLAQTPGAASMGDIFKAYQHANTPGCAVGVDAPGKETWTAAYGMADLEQDVPNTAATVFEAGSVSKQFTAAAVLLLAQRGKLSLDDDIRRYFPELPAYKDRITVRQLLNHTSGLRDWGDLQAFAGWPRTTREYTHAHVLEILGRQRELNYKPGDAWSYTNSGYNLAAMLVERVSGMTLQAFTTREFFQPLGMASTQWRDDFHRLVPHRAIAYRPVGLTWSQNMPFEDAYGNGGLLTTVADLLKWNANIASGKLYPSIFEQMQKPSVLNDGRVVRYGLGLYLDPLQGLTQVSHSGATAGYRAWLGRLTAGGLSTAILCNAASADTTDLAAKVNRLYLDLEAPRRPGLPAHIQPGLYRNRRERRTMKVEEQAGSLQFNGSPTRADVRFAGQTMIVANADYGEDIWDRVEPWTPLHPADFTGTYTSDEVDVTLQVNLVKGALVIRRKPDSTFPLNPACTDAFESALGTVRFQRNPRGKVIALDLADSRVWNLRLARRSDRASAPNLMRPTHSASTP